MTDRAVPAWRYAIAGSLAAAIGLAAMLWFGQRGDGAPGAGTRASAAVPVERAATVVTDPPAGAFAPAAQALPAPSAPPSPAQVHEMFTAAVRKAREAPAATPLPGIAKARSFEEAFQAMRAAEPAPPSPGAGAAAQSPFGALR